MMVDGRMDNVRCDGSGYSGVTMSCDVQVIRQSRLLLPISRGYTKQKSSQKVARHNSLMLQSYSQTLAQNLSLRMEKALSIFGDLFI